jgi:peptide/nickel transport system substrate-binding protein
MMKSKKILAAVLAAVMAVFPLASCSGGKTASSGKENGKTAASDTIIYAQGADPRGLDPALVDDGESGKIIVNIYEGLLKYNKDSTKVEPSLAESWDVSKDGLSYTFHLRKGVKFQDGTDFNAEAVKYNIDRQLPDKATEDMSYAGFVYGAVKDVEVVDENTVKINLKTPSTPFLNNLAMCMAAPIISPTALKKYNNNVNEHPVGTGPYTFVSWTKSQNVVLTRNDNYWGDKAKIKNVIFKFIPDNSARVVALNNGEADLIDGIDSTVVDQIKQGGGQIFQSPGMSTNYLASNVTKSPTKDVEVRKAIAQAINVPELVKSLYKGYAETATSILPTFMAGYDKSISQVAYDPDAAKKAFAAKGITSLHMITYTNPRPYNPANGQALAEAVMGYLDKVGVKCQLDSYDWATYKEKIKAGDYDVCFYGWIGDNGDPDNFMNLLSDQDPTMNVARYNNSKFNEGIQKAVAMPEGNERSKAYTDLEKMAAADAVWVPISHATNLIAYRPNVKGFVYHMTGVIFLSQATKG